MVSRRIAGVVIAAGCVLALSGCTGEETEKGEGAPIVAPGKPGEPNKTLSPEEAKEAAKPTPPNEADVEYVGMMIVHHQQAIEMSDLAEKHATEKMVRGLAARIAAAQGPEIDMMNKWLKEHGKPTVAPAPEGGHDGGHGDHEAPDHSGMPGMASEEEMAALAEARGEAFDRTFLKLMIAHHQGALTMARKVQNAGADIRVQEMADDVIATQSAEIRRMQTMLES